MATKSWQDYEIDQILNFEGGQTATVARFERIMAYKTIQAIDQTNGRMSGLMDVINKSNQTLKSTTSDMIAEYKKIASSQQRQQIR